MNFGVGKLKGWLGYEQFTLLSSSFVVPWMKCSFCNKTLEGASIKTYSNGNASERYELFFVFFWLQAGLCCVISESFPLTLNSNTPSDLISLPHLPYIVIDQVIWDWCGYVNEK